MKKYLVLSLLVSMVYQANFAMEHKEFFQEEGEYIFMCLGLHVSHPTEKTTFEALENYFAERGLNNQGQVAAYGRDKKPFDDPIQFNKAMNIILGRNAEGEDSDSQERALMKLFHFYEILKARPNKSSRINSKMAMYCV